jgi:hypothetical protein
MSYMRKILLFVISAAMVVVGLLLLAFGLLAAMPRGGRLRSSDCICCGRISLRRCSHVADLAVATDVTTALVETIDDLAALVPPDGLDDRLRARLHEARRYKIIDAIVNIDMQDPAATLVPAAQNPADDKDGMRDFSPETVRRRRRDGFKFAHEMLRPTFENRRRAQALANAGHCSVARHTSGT